MRFTITGFIVFFFSMLHSQELPVHFAPGERELMKSYLEQVTGKGGAVPPPGSVRSPGEWEEIDYLVITWRSYKPILAQIVDHAQKEAVVLIHCSDSVVAKAELISYGVTPVNVQFVEANTNTLWIRDYGAQPVYRDGVDSLYLIDWIYNRPRPLDNAIPGHTASALGLPLYQATQVPYALVNTGGNYMSDGFGKAFSSQLILDENQNLTKSQIDTIMKKFLGIDTFINMTNLPYDGIHHIDMHMKLLDEETLLVGEYPQGVSDGPQIEANLLYVLHNYRSVFGTPFRVIRIPMPPSPSGLYPHQGAYYRTYTNAVFVNRALLVPTYYEEYDTVALRILREALPGYEVIGINASDIIPASGAIHCITNSVATRGPLLISHQPLRGVQHSTGSYPLEALVRHRSGIESASVHYTTDTTAGYQQIPMTPSVSDPHRFEGQIPSQAQGTEVFYYITATSYSGKNQARPMPAPRGYWSFVADPKTGVIEHAEKTMAMGNPFPNPARAITAIPVYTERPEEIYIDLINTSGQVVDRLFNGQTETGKNHYFLDASRYPAGVYFIRARSLSGNDVKKLIIP